MKVIITGLGRKSVACILLLALRKKDFPVSYHFRALSISDLAICIGVQRIEISFHDRIGHRWIILSLRLKDMVELSMEDKIVSCGLQLEASKFAGRHKCWKNLCTPWLAAA